jgi:hypothetical protein
MFVIVRSQRRKTHWFQEYLGGVFERNRLSRGTSRKSNAAKQ